MAVIPIESWIIDLADPQQPRLIGGRCTACGEYYFPMRHHCAKAECLAPCEEVRLSTRGVLYTWTYVPNPRWGKAQVDKPYLVGQVDLPEGTRIQGILEGDPQKIEIGMQMRLATTPIEQKGEDTVVSYCFVPDEEGAAS